MNCAIVPDVGPGCGNRSPSTSLHHWRPWVLSLPVYCRHSWLSDSNEVHTARSTHENLSVSITELIFWQMHSPHSMMGTLEFVTRKNTPSWRESHPKPIPNSVLICKSTQPLTRWSSRRNRYHAKLPSATGQGRKKHSGRNAASSGTTVIICQRKICTTLSHPYTGRMCRRVRFANMP